MTKVCCGPITRVSGIKYECQCGRDVTDEYRSAGLAGEVIRWIGERKFILDNKDRDRWPHIVKSRREQDGVRK